MFRFESSNLLLAVVFGGTNRLVLSFPHARGIVAIPRHEAQSLTHSLAHSLIVGTIFGVGTICYKQVGGTILGTGTSPKQQPTEHSIYADPNM